jgi:Bacterial regulatory proteins, lacI family
MNPDPAKSKKSKVQVVTLKAVAHLVGVTPGAVSAVLNNAPA